MINLDIGVVSCSEFARVTDYSPALLVTIIFCFTFIQIEMLSNEDNYSTED